MCPSILYIEISGAASFCVLNSINLWRMWSAVNTLHKATTTFPVTDFG